MFKSLFIVAMAIGLLNIIDYIYASTSVDAATSGITASATINPSSTLTISSTNASLDIVPSASGTFGKSNAITVSTYVNTSNTCTVTLKSKTSETALKSGSNSISTLASETTQANFPNERWGFQVGSSNFKPVSSSGTTIASYSSNTGSTAQTVNVYYAAKLTAATKPGTYTNTVTITSTCANS